MALVVKNLPIDAGDVKRHGFYPRVGKISWRRAWQSTPVFLPGESPWTEEPGMLQSKGLLSRVRPFATPWSAARQAPLPMGILQARILEWIAMPSSRGSSQPRHQTQISHIAGRFFTI